MEANEAKMIVASNLTVAIWIRELYFATTGGGQYQSSEKVIPETYEKILKALK